MLYVLSWRFWQLGLLSWRMFSDGRAFYACVCGPASRERSLSELRMQPQQNIVCGVDGAYSAGDVDETGETNFVKYSGSLLVCIRGTSPRRVCTQCASQRVSSTFAICSLFFPPFFVTQQQTGCPVVAHFTFFHIICKKWQRSFMCTVNQIHCVGWWHRSVLVHQWTQTTTFNLPRNRPRACMHWQSLFMESRGDDALRAASSVKSARSLHTYDKKETEPTRVNDRHIRPYLLPTF